MYHLFEQQADNKNLPDLMEESHQEEEKEEAFCCAHCDNVLVLKSHGMSMQGQHRHHFVNPQGVLYEVACFQQALGVAVYGDPSYHWTWFVGYAWQVVLCGRCKTHVGWKFTGADNFFALIENQLINCRNKLQED